MYSESGFSFGHQKHRRGYDRNFREDAGDIAIQGNSEFESNRNNMNFNSPTNRGQRPANFDQFRFSSSRYRNDAVQYNQGGGRNRAPQPVYDSQSKDTRGRREHTKPGGQSTRNFCHNFAITGSCKFGNSCMFRHEILKMGGSEHTKRIDAACCEVATLQDGQLEIYVASKENDFTRFVLTKEERSGTVKVKLENSSALSSSVLSSVFHEDCLFCGMHSGDLIVMHTKTWASLILQGHTAPVYALLFIDNILISGDWEGNVKLWEFEKSTSQFTCIKTMQTQCKITCMKELSVTDGEKGLTRSLWIGGTAILIVDLVSLSVVRTIGNARHVCVSLVKFQEFMVAGFATGAIKIFSLDGEEVTNYNGPFLSCLEGMVVQNVPILLYGTDRGFIHAIRLPELEELGSLKTQQHGGNVGITKIVNLGDGHFLSCTAYGQLSIWKWTV